MRTLKQITDERLSAVTWSTEQGMRLLNQKREGGARRLRRPAVVALALVLALMAASALAVGLQMSRRVEVKRLARQCVRDAYGLDEQTLTMFVEHAAERDGAWVVTYSYWQPEQGGTYTVTLPRHGQPSVVWSLEGAPDAWGQAEIAAYMAEKKAQAANPELRTPEPTATPAARRMTETRVIGIARDALRERYHMTDKALEALLPMASYADGVWQVSWCCPFWPEADSRIGTYDIRISDADGKLQSATWSLEEQAAVQPNRAQLARLTGYDAACLEWVADYVALYKASMEEAPISPETNAAMDALMIEMGFDPAQYNHVLPDEGDIPLAAAKELAYEALHSEFGMTRALYESSVFAYADLTRQADHREWYFWIQNPEELQGWSVLLDAQTGEILDLFAESTAAGNG